MAEWQPKGMDKNEFNDLLLEIEEMLDEQLDELIMLCQDEKEKRQH